MSREQLGKTLHNRLLVFSELACGSVIELDCPDDMLIDDERNDDAGLELVRIATKANFPRAFHDARHAIFERFVRAVCLDRRAELVVFLIGSGKAKYLLAVGNGNSICNSCRQKEVANRLCGMRIEALAHIGYRLCGQVKRLVRLPCTGVIGFARTAQRVDRNDEQAGNRIQPIGGVIYRDLSDWCKISKGSELSIVNKASLSFEIIYGECRLLFCGDADMNRYKERLLHHYDVIKLSHHGTYIGNECFCNSSQVIADNYIISTNGQRKEHPNRRLLAEVLMQPHCKKLLLNYDLSKIKNEQYYLLYDEKQQAKYAFNTITTQSIAFGEKHNDGN